MTDERRQLEMSESAFKSLGLDGLSDFEIVYWENDYEGVALRVSDDTYWSFCTDDAPILHEVFPYTTVRYQ